MITETLSLLLHSPYALFGGVDAPSCVFRNGASVLSRGSSAHAHLCAAARVEGPAPARLEAVTETQWTPIAQAEAWPKVCA